jgi:hypothetical protein
MNGQQKNMNDSSNINNTNDLVSNNLFCSLIESVPYFFLDMFSSVFSYTRLLWIKCSHVLCFGSKLPSNSTMLDSSGSTEWGIFKLSYTISCASTIIDVPLRVFTRLYSSLTVSNDKSNSYLSVFFCILFPNRCNISIEILIIFCCYLKVAELKAVNRLLCSQLRCKEEENRNLIEEKKEAEVKLVRIFLLGLSIRYFYSWSWWIVADKFVFSRSYHWSMSL